MAYPATSPGLLASFMVIRPGEQLVTVPDATSELYYCLRGAGHSDVRTVAGRPAPAAPGGCLAGRATS